MKINCIYKQDERCLYHNKECFLIRNEEAHCRNQVKEFEYNEPDFNIQVSYDEDDIC